MNPALPNPRQMSGAPVRSRRPRRLPATGLAVKNDNRRAGTIASVLIHLLIIFLIVTPFATHTGVVIEKPQGAGGPGPAGGGGGGKRGTGGALERVQYVQTAPPPAPTPVAVIPPPTPIPLPVIVPPPIAKPPEPTPDVRPDLKVDVKPAEATAPVVGVGGGTGKDGTNGTGPGTGGGTGSGNGTGRGSGNGPGTGGGVQANYAPTPTELFIPPLPFPSKLRGFHLVAEFDVDENGKVVDWKFNGTGDGGYDRRLNDVLKATKFRPGTTPAGVPIRMKTQIVYDF